MRNWMLIAIAAVCLPVFGCGDATDEGTTDEGTTDDVLSGDPNATLDDQLDRIAEGESAHGALDSKADDVLPGFEDALNVDLPVITIAEDVPVPSYQRAEGGNGFGLGGTEFWQKWAGGHNPTYSYSDGTDAGRKCMQASAIRFQAIMKDVPKTYTYALETTNWSGRHFNWNDDFSEPNARGSASGATLWAWRTGLMKFISQTGKNGKCHLVTRAQVEAAGIVCALRAEGAEGETQGCAVRAYEVDRVLNRYAAEIAEINAPEADEPAEVDPDAVRFEGEVDVAIPDSDETGVTTSISVDAEGVVSAVTIEVEIEHTYISDLTVILAHGDVEEVLHKETGGADDNLSINLVSEAFAGTDKAGEWSLTVIDNAAQDTGVIKSFAISL